MGSCKHLQQAINIGRFTVFASGSSALRVILPKDIGATQTRHEPKDVAVYLDPRSWSNRVQPRKGIAYLDWPDMGVISDIRFRRVLTHLISALTAGKEVETGCIGGHGRTGTLLAGLMALLENCSAEEAIKRVRSRYCKWAVESRGQVLMIYTLLGETPPAVPIKPSKSAVSSTDDSRWSSFNKSASLQEIMEEAKKVGISVPAVTRTAEDIALGCVCVDKCVCENGCVCARSCVCTVEDHREFGLLSEEKEEDDDFLGVHLNDRDFNTKY